MKVKETELHPFGLILTPTEQGISVKDVDIDYLRGLISKHQLVTLRGFDHFSSSEEFSNYCESWGEISLWPFGKVLELIEQENPQDHIFDNSYIPLHWDGMYREQVPELQIFHCAKAPGKDHGGRTVFSNTKMLLESISPKLKDEWNQVTAYYERKMEFYESKTTAPLITKHPTKNYDVIRFCEPPKITGEEFINHPGFELKGLSENNKSDFLSTLETALYSPANYYAHEWEDGDIVLSDNHTLLHGREAFTSGSARHLRRVQILDKTPLDNPHLVYTK